jgi:hypothetical protein
VRLTGERHVRLATVRPGDIIRAAGLHALVVEKPTARVIVVKGLCNGSLRRLHADEVEAHWRAPRGGSRP